MQLIAMGLTIVLSKSAREETTLFRYALAAYRGETHHFLNSGKATISPKLTPVCGAIGANLR